MPSRWFLSRWLSLSESSRAARAPRNRSASRRSMYRPSLELLEDRVNPAGTFTLNGTLLTIAGDPGGNNNFQLGQTTTLSGGAPQTTYTFTMDGTTQSYTESQVSQVMVNAAGANGSATLYTNNTYTGADNLPHETVELVKLWQGGGQVLKNDRSGVPQLFLQLNNFASSSAYLGNADLGQVFGSGGAAAFGVHANYTTMQSATDSHFLWGTPFVTVFASTPNDSVSLDDQNETFVGGPSLSSLSSTDGQGSTTELHQAFGFNHVVALAAPGNTASATLNGGNGANQFLVSAFNSATTQVTMTGTNQGQAFSVAAVGFLYNKGVTTHAGDTAVFYDTVNNDVFYGGASASSMFSNKSDGSLAGYFEADGFAHVNAYAFMGGTNNAFNYAPAVNLLSGFALPSTLIDPNTLITPSASTSSTATPVLTLNLNPLDINLLGLEVKTSAIQVKVSAQPGQGELLGNLLNTVGNLLNLQGVNNALNTVLGNVVTLLNSASLSVTGATGGSGPLTTAATATTPVLDLFVAPIHLNLLGALVDTSPIHLTITAHSGPGLILGNVIADLANLFNPPLPSTLNLDTINNALQNLLNELNAQIPGIASSPSPTAVVPAGTERVLALTVAPINVNLLGLVLKTSQIQVNADALTGNGNLLGNVLTTLLNTLGATPQNLTTLNNNLNAILAKVIGVLNASSLALPGNAVSTLSQTLQNLALPNLINNSTGSAMAPILNLTIASPDGSSPPVNVDLLGLKITTSNIQAQLLAQTGDGQVLGNLLYNVANLLNPGGTASLLSILNSLGV